MQQARTQQTILKELKSKNSARDVETELFIKKQNNSLKVGDFMAEKVETILRRGVFNTRPRDFYDAYILATTQKFDKAVFVEALKATAAHRGTTEQIADIPTIMKNIEESVELRTMWDKYRKQFAYAEHIEYEKIVILLNELVKYF